MRAVVQRVTSASVEARHAPPNVARAATLRRAAARRLPPAPGAVRPRPPQVEGEVVSRIGPGLLCLVGITTGDTEKDAEFL